MPTVTTGGATLHYETAGDADRPTLAFVPGVGFGPWMWGWQAPDLSGTFRAVVYAARGTDGSTAAGPYSLDRFADDLEAVLADAGVPRVHLVGAGLGGAVALRYAREYGRARSVTTFGSPPSGGDLDQSALEALHPSDPTRLRESLSLAFSERFLVDSELVDDIVGWRREEDATGEALAAHREAALAVDLGPLYEVTLPVLVCHGVDDPVVDPGVGEALASALPRGRFEAVEGKRLCFVEHAAAVDDAVAGFVEEIASP